MAFSVAWMRENFPKVRPHRNPKPERDIMRLAQDPRAPIVGLARLEPESLDSEQSPTFISKKWVVMFHHAETLREESIKKYVLKPLQMQSAGSVLNN